MQLCTASFCFAGYPLDRIPNEALAHLQSRPNWATQLSARVLRLQCFLEITDQSWPPTDQGPAGIEALLQDFAAASFAGLIGPGSSPSVGAAALRRAWMTPLSVALPTTTNSQTWPDGFAERVEYYRNLRVDSDLAEFWQGWTFKNAKNKQITLALWRFWKTFGKQRTRELAQATKEWIGKGRRSEASCAQSFADFACDYGAIDFARSESIGEVFSQFFRHYFQSGHDRGVRLSSLGSKWRAFSLMLHGHLLGKAWATPVPALATPRLPQIAGASTNLVRNAQGHDVKLALITPVPLHVTDSQATELIFSSIKSDTDAILRWARKEVAEARERRDQRRELAKKGTISQASATGVTTGLRYRLARHCPEHLAHASATFEAHGFNHLNSNRPAHLIYPEPAAQTAWELGLPSRQLLLAHAAVLVASHPQITPAFLEELNLFDKDGQQVGFITTDAGWILRGEKRRRGPAKALQDVLLNEETQSVVRDVIALTEPLRKWLRSKGKAEWRRLFLGVASIGSQPRAWRAVRESIEASDWIAERMQALTGIGAERATLLSQRFSLRRLRASAGVLIYFETGSAEEMAKALGHAKWSPALLDHYLPRPLQEFFTERWIRLFQAGIICEAMQGSSKLLEASAFQTMDELDSFLENHALRRIPSHLETPDHPGGKNQTTHAQDRISFGIETGILTILISLANAVRTSSREPCGRAIRWARISERLIPFLESTREQPEFQSMVIEAKRKADPGLVEGLIYD